MQVVRDRSSADIQIESPEQRNPCETDETRGWLETRTSWENPVTAARAVRAELTAEGF